MTKYKFFHFNHESPLDGIFASFGPERKKYFQIEASTLDLVPDTTPYNITSRDNPSSYVYWATASSENEMIISFYKSILITSYTIENAGQSHSWMRNWTIFGSNNKKEWLEIDHREDEEFCTYYIHESKKYCGSPNPRSNQTYVVQNPKYFHHILFRCEENSLNSKYIIMRSLEFFGLIPYSPLCSIVRRYICFNQALFIISLFIE